MTPHAHGAQADEVARSWQQRKFRERDHARGGEAQIVFSIERRAFHRQRRIHTQLRAEGRIPATQLESETILYEPRRRILVPRRLCCGIEGHQRGAQNE